jgi:uncharacterized repeat protein (TIGR02543 family)
MAPQTASSPTELISNTFTRTGYRFNGWNTAPDGSGTAYSNNQLYDFLADLTLYAQWTARNYIVTFDSNGGTTPDPASISVTYEAAYGTLATTSRTGYTFDGWFTLASGGTQVTAATIVTTASNHTLFAQWTADTYTVTFDKNGGTVDADPTTRTGILYNGTVTLPTPPQWPGHTFSGWNTQANGSGTAFTASTPVIASLTVYAQWTLDTHLLTVNKTGTGTGTVTSDITGINCGGDCTETYDYGTSVILTATPTDHYNRLTGWSGTGISCPGTGTCTVSMNAAKTVTATFEKATFGDVPFDYPRWAYIQALYEGGYTSGCQADPLLFCPEATLTRAESAVFMLRGLLGAGYEPPTEPSGYVFVNDDWAPSTVSWARSWAEGMWDEGMTSGCQADPLKFCPAATLTRAEGSVFGERIKNGKSYTPPAATHIFTGDDWTPDSVSWAEPWAEQAYHDGLLLSCGTSPLKFCPADPLSRSWAAYIIAVAKGLTLP